MFVWPRSGFFLPNSAHATQKPHAKEITTRAGVARLGRVRSFPGTESFRAVLAREARLSTEEGTLVVLVEEPAVATTEEIANKQQPTRTVRGNEVRNFFMVTGIRGGVQPSLYESPPGGLT